MARSRERRRQSYTSVLRGNRSASNENDAPQAPQIEERSGFPWRGVSALMILCLSAVLALFFLTDAFYVRGVSVSGVRYMTRQEVFTYADIARMHIFWVEPETVRDNVRRYPTVADAEVHLSWPPNMVHIIVEERAPALIWVQNETAVWVDIQGNTMALREDRDDLIRIVASDPLADGPLGDSGRLSTDVVYGVLQLQELRPDIPEWRYDVTRGLGFQNENGWTVWLGTGTTMPQKLQIYEALRERLLAEGRSIREINLTNPDAPVYMSLE